MRGSRVRVPSSAPRRNGLRSIPIFLYRKISQPLRHSSLFAKRHARLTCSLVNALTTAHSRYHLFASPRGFVWTALHSDFSLQKNQSAAPSFLLCRKRLRLRRLFVCNRTHNAFGSLPTFCEVYLFGTFNLTVFASIKKPRGGAGFLIFGFISKSLSVRLFEKPHVP